MKNLLYILFLALLISGCTTSRKSSQSTTVTTSDTTVGKEEQTVKQTNDRDKETTIRDSAIGIPEKKVDDSLTVEEQETPTTKKGVKKPVYKEKSIDGLTAWIKVDTNGTINFGAKSDSITLLVRNLIREKETISERYENLYKWVQNQKSQSVKTTETVIVKEKTWWGNNWRFVLLAVVALILMLFLIFKKVT